MSVVPYDTDGSSAALRSNPPRRPADKLRNIYTTAPKKGGFGMPWKDMTLGEPPKYYSDVYEGGREKEKVGACMDSSWELPPEKMFRFLIFTSRRDGWATAHCELTVTVSSSASPNQSAFVTVQELRKSSKPVGRKPFVSAANTSRPFTPDSQAFHAERPQSTAGAASSGGRSGSSSPQRSMSAPRERPHVPVWRPASGKKLGAAASSFGIPEYVPDPVREAKVSWGHTTR